MKLNKLLLGSLIGLACLHVLFNAFLSSHFPDHREAGSNNRHPMIDLQNAPRMLEMQNEDPQQQEQQQQQPKDDVAHPQRNRRKKKNYHAILKNENLNKLPTANTISPYLKHPLFEGKERLLTMLHEAHFFNDSSPQFFADPKKVIDLSKKLPLWETITDRLGGENPAIEGLDTCEDFRARVAPEDRFMGVAGLFATGTNLLASLLVANCENRARQQKYGGTGVRWQVNWGKHTPARYRLENRIDQGLKNEDYLPIVTIRSPYSWMQSMCRQRYSTHWFHNAKEHCPNLVPNEIDHRWYNYTIKHGKRGINRLYKDPWLRDNLLDLANFTLDATAVPVRVRYKAGNLFHTSLAHMWNEWYHEYLDGDFPRVVVRLEDLVFHAKEVVTKVCTCMGGHMAKDFQYVTETAKVGDDKIHGSDRTNLIKWFTKWHLEDRTKNMTAGDRAYAQEHLDGDLMKQFQYIHPQPETESS